MRCVSSGLPRTKGAIATGLRGMKTANWSVNGLECCDIVDMPPCRCRQSDRDCFWQSRNFSYRCHRERDSFSVRLVSIRAGHMNEMLSTACRRGTSLSMKHLTSVSSPARYRGRGRRKRFMLISKTTRIRALCARATIPETTSPSSHCVRFIYLSFCSLHRESSRADAA